MELKDQEMMETPSAWPIPQILPIKRPPADGMGWPEVGMLLHTEDGYFFIPGVSIFDLPRIGVDDHRVVADPSIEDLIKEGWLVD